LTDTILFNGRIATIESVKPAATAVAIEDGSFCGALGCRCFTF